MVFKPDMPTAMHIWFLKIDPVQIVGMRVYVCVCAHTRTCMCVSTPETVNNQWHDMDPYDWLNKFYSCYMATVTVIINGCGLGIDAHCGN